MQVFPVRYTDEKAPLDANGHAVSSISIAPSFSHQLRTPAPHPISTAGDWTHGVAPIPGMIDSRQSLGTLGHRYFQNILVIPPFHEPSTVGFENINNPHASIKEDSIKFATIPNPTWSRMSAKRDFHAISSRGTSFVCWRCSSASDETHQRITESLNP